MLGRGGVAGQREKITGGDLEVVRDPGQQGCLRRADLAALEAENLGSVHADVRREIAGRQLARSPKSADVSAQPNGLFPIH